MLRRIYDWTLEKAAGRAAERWLALIAFLESSVFPIPPDALMLPMCVARPSKSFRIAAICTIASVLGALLGYAIGLFMLETVGAWVITLYGLEEKFAEFSHNFNEQGWLIVFLAGFTPLPFKLITITAGATQMPLAVLMLAALISRGARFFLVAALIYRFGTPMKQFIDRHFAWLTIAFGVLLIAGFAVIKFLV